MNDASLFEKDLARFLTFHQSQNAGLAGAAQKLNDVWQLELEQRSLKIHSRAEGKLSRQSAVPSRGSGGLEVAFWPYCPKT